MILAAAGAGTATVSCGGSPPPASSSAPAQSSTTALGPPRPGPVPTGSSGPVVSPGHGWVAASGLQGPVPGPGSCRDRSASDGGVLPDPACTPGAVDATVTQADLVTTLCRPGGYTRSVRPPESLTEPFKATVMRAYDATGALGAYELDHLVPLELGGSSDTRNLWPEPDDRPGRGVANSKDRVERDLHDMVCAAVAGRPSVPLRVAQDLVATDWTTAIPKARAALVPAR